jgi:tetratricopeptide (TPR) repeat protein
LPSGTALEQWAALLSLAGVVVVTGLVIWDRRRTPAAVAGWTAYVLLVLPVSGLMQTGLSAVAQRYAYLAMAPLLLLAGGAVVWLWRRSPIVMRVGITWLLVGEVCLFGMQTRSLIPVWHDDETLWRSALEEFPDSLVANNAILLVLVAHNRMDEAFTYAQRYLELMPRFANSHNNLGFILAAMGRISEARDEYERALQLKPDYPEAHNNLANTLAQLGKMDEAMQQYELALRIKPKYVDAHLGMGSTLFLLGRRDEAIRQYEQALALNPDLAIASNMLARLRAAP